MPARCSECGGSLAGKPAGTKTDSIACRSKRARRLKREAKERAQAPPHQAAVSDVVTKGVRDAAHEVLKEELRPLVREQMTEAVLTNIQDLVNVTPTAIEKLKEDLENGDDAIRQRAYTLLLKYTLGNPSVAPPPIQQAPGGLNVTFNIPRPGDEHPPGPGDVEATEVDELRECQDCHESKPVGQFVAGSERCEACFASTRELLKERFGDAYAG